MIYIIFNFIKSSFVVPDFPDFSYILFSGKNIKLFYVQ